MTWNANTPRGDLLPVDERPRFQGNFTYTETTLQNDHYFDEDTDHDGHHKAVVFTDIADTGIALTGNDPTNLPMSTEGMFYVRPKTSAEAPDGQFSEPFYMMNDGARNQFMQLGFRAMATVDVGASPGFTITEKYIHNCSVTRDSVGLYTVTFTTQMPTDNYIVMGTAIGKSTTAYLLTVKPDPVLANVLDATQVKIRTGTPTATLDPIRFMVAIIGG